MICASVVQEEEGRRDVVLFSGLGDVYYRHVILIFLHKKELNAFMRGLGEKKC